jgi:hypothetical protein
MNMLKHLERHRKAYERHEAGETYREIAEDLGVSTPRARQIAKRWEQELKRFTDMAQSPQEVCVTVSLVCPHCSGILHVVLGSSGEYEHFTHTCGETVHLRLESFFMEPTR